MKIVCVGAGPAGLAFASLARLRLPGASVSVVERNPRGVTFGWGVVFSEALHRDLARHDPEMAAEIARAATFWEDQHVHVRGARAVHLGRYGFSIGRARLLDILSARAERLGVRIEYERELADASELADAHLVVAADGARSRLREARAARFGTRVDWGRNRYIWLGTRREFRAFTFGFEQTPSGWIWFHAYRYSPEGSTFIAECSPETWQGLGFDRLDAAAGTQLLEKIFAGHLQGHALVDQMGALGRAGWLTFGTITNQSWVDGNVVLMGDSAHTAHFSIGSGTLLAVGDAVALADQLTEGVRLPAALAAYEAERRPAVAQRQADASNSARWFESIGQLIDQPPVEFGYALLRRREGLPAPPEPSPRWGYWLHRARQVPMLNRMRRQVSTATRLLRGRAFR